jgi:hypothetical protein
MPLILPGRVNPTQIKPGAQVHLDLENPFSTGLKIQTLFNDAYGTTVHNMVPNGINGVASAATWKNDARFGVVISPGGANPNKIDYTASAAKLTTASNTTKWSMEFWVNHSALAGNAGYADYFDFDASSIEIWNDYATGKPHFSIGGTDLVSSVALTVGKWYHLIFVFDGANLLIYINGVKTGSAAQATTPLNTVTTNDWYLFNDASGGGALIGTASSYRYWVGRALIAAEVFELYVHPFANVYTLKDRVYFFIAAIPTGGGGTISAPRSPAL